MEEIFDVIIIGSGPAGLTAGLYTSRADLKTGLFTGSNWGGQLMLTTLVENFPGFPDGVQGPELMQRMRDQAGKFGVKYLEEDVTSIDFSKRPFKINNLSARSVIIATGAKTKWLGLPNEQKLIGRGVSSCAPCDAPFFRNKRVAVVGGGDAAMEEVQVLSRFASEVTVLHRRDVFKASQIMQERVFANPKVKILKNVEVTDILGDDKVTGIKYKNVATNETSEMELDGIFVAIGHLPDCELFKSQIKTDHQGYIVSRRHGAFLKQEDDGSMLSHAFHTMTSVEGVFVAGDVHDLHYRQAITAAGYGCEAALEVERWLTEVK